MSSILKALRKLEEEKAALGEGRVDLARDILKRSAPRRRSSTPLVFKVVFFTVLVLGLVAGMWLALGPPDTIDTADVIVPPGSEPLVVSPSAPAEPVAKRSAANQQTLETVAPVESHALSNSVSAVQSETELTAARVENEPVPEAEVQIVEIEERHIPQVEGKFKEMAKTEQQIEVTESLPVSAPPATLEKNRVDSETPVEALPVEHDPAVQEENPVVASKPGFLPMEPSIVDMSLPANLPDLKVSAIAYKSTPGERLAVVNDLPVMEGTSIEGVQIVEIQEQGVRFSWQEMEFVLPLTAENSTN